MVSLTRSSSDGRATVGPPPARNPRAAVSVLVGALAVAAVPAGVAVSWYSESITLVQSSVSAAVAFLLGAYAILLGRRAREKVALTLGRCGGARAARVGLVLGTVGVLAGITAGLAVGFYGLLTLFD
jgi:hypothetical protein